MKKIKSKNDNLIRSTQKGLLLVLNFVSLMDEDVTIGKEITNDLKDRIDRNIENGAKVPAIVVSELVKCQVEYS